MADAVKQMKQPGSKVDPDAPCNCGIPGCKGHEPDAEGKVHIFHPNGKHYVLDMSRHTAN
jgi:hypothetical protein